MIDPLTSEYEEVAVVRRPFLACKKCVYYGMRREIARTSEGLVDICNLENLCRNAVHIAWMSLDRRRETGTYRQTE